MASLIWNKALTVIGRTAVASVLVSFLIWLIQDMLIFPLLPRKFFVSDILIPPDNMQEFMVSTPDGESLSVWTTWGKTPDLDASYVGLVFHGNGETVKNKNFLPFFARHRIPAFTFDYRGYGNSTGWINEERLLADAELVWAEIQRRTGIPASRAIILGNSIGSAPAAWLASRIKPAMLILLAGYISIPEIADDMPLYRPFSWLLRYRLPTAEFLHQTQTPCLVLAHGKQDEVISYRHLNVLAAAVDKDKVGKLLLMPNDEASHNNIYYRIESELDQAIDSCTPFAR